MEWSVMEPCKTDNSSAAGIVVGENVHKETMTCLLRANIDSFQPVPYMLPKIVTQIV